MQRTQLGLNLIAVLCQRLAKRRDGKGSIPVVEIMMATPLVRKYILEGEFDKLKGAVGNRESGSQSFDQHLTELFGKQIIDVAEAKRLASNVDALNLALRGISNSDTRLRLIGAYGSPGLSEEIRCAIVREGEAERPYHPSFYLRPTSENSD